MANKIQFFILLFFINSGSLISQVEISNKFLVGGFFSMNQSNQNFPKSDLFNAGTYKNRLTNGSIYLGYELDKKKVIGISGEYSTSFTQIQILGSNSQNTFDEDPTRSKEQGLSLFFRYYIGEKSKINFFIEPSIFYSASDAGQNLDNKFDLNSKGADINLGVSLNLSPRWNLLVNMYKIRYVLTEKYFLISDQVETDENLDFSFNLKKIQLGAEWLF